ncbi:MAG: TetR/AcrR family transcriptional regulator [Spirochaetaceae bacterium]|nr:MAG: TetR/AcrR family transcriptional regulator [Spirochaetaceae bacterium]
MRRINSVPGDKRAKRKQDIIFATLTAWNRTEFTVLTMETVARQLGCTKPALYRYYASKEQLMRAVETEAVNQVLTALNAWHTEALGLPLRESTGTLVSRADDLFAAHPSFVPCVAARGPLLEAAQRESLKTATMRTLSTLAQQSDDSTASYLLFSVAFWYSFREWLPLLRSQNTDFKHPDIDREWILHRCLHGLSDPAAERHIDFAEVERVFRVEPGEARREPHRIFSAIAEVVASEGIENATVQRIASRIGISPGSLYHYFANRSEMLEETMQQEQQAFLDLLKPRISSHRGTPIEALYGVAMLLDRYYRENPEVPVVAGWIKAQMVPVGDPSSPPVLPEIGDGFSFLQKGIDEGWFSAEVTVRSILAAVHVYTAFDHLFAARTGRSCGTRINPAQTFDERLRHRFLPLAFGIHGTRSKDQKGTGQ